MNNDNLNRSAILNIESNITTKINYDNVIKEFLVTRPEEYINKYYSNY
jgi:hypothetical protein